MAANKRLGAENSESSLHFLLFQFSTSGAKERETTCESFELLLKTLHQAMLFQQSPLSLELGVVDGQVVQAFRTENQHAARTIKNGLKNSFVGCRLSNLPDEAFVPQAETSIYSADVQLTNDLYSIRRWKELLTESDPLTGLLASLAVNQHARFFGHVSISMIPMNNKKQKIHRDCFLTLQSVFFQKHERVAHLFESAARSNSLLLRTFARPMRLIGRDARQQEPSITVGSSRHHERETDTQSASNKLNSSCFMTSIRIRVFGPADQMHLASSLIHQIFAPLAQYNSPRLGQFKIGEVRTKPLGGQMRFVLSCSEVASIFHPPTTKTERLATTRLVQLEPPRKLPDSKHEKDIVEIGKTQFHDQSQGFGLHDRDAGLHGFVVGSSGSGKTTLLTTAIDSLIKRGQGVTLVDFHGDFAAAILKRVPAKFHNKVVDFCPLRENPVPFNPLSCPNQEDWPLIADSVLSGMKNLFGNS